MVGGSRGSGAHEACLIILVTLAAGCAVQMYPGPRLPRAETARLVGDHATIASIDGMQLPVGSIFMLRAGWHEVSATGLDAEGDRVGPLAICFDARGGGSYQLRFGGIARRLPEMIDGDTGLLVPTTSIPVGQRCAAPPPRPIVASAPPVAAEAAAAAPPAVPAETAADVPPPAPAAAAALARPEAVDDETPRTPRRRRPARATYGAREADEIRPRWFRHPGNGFMFDFGVFFGGTDLATATFSDGSTSTLSGGSGVLLSVGLMLTPLWAGDGAGFGVDAFASLKYDSVGDSSNDISLTRYPLGVGAHVLLHIDDRWWFILRGGILKEVGISLGGSYVGGDLAGSLGGFGEGGIYYVLSGLEDHAALALTIRYSVSTDSANGASISANSGGAIVALHFNF